jgi:putative ABC transport system substrate-binding protein
MLQLLSFAVPGSNGYAFAFTRRILPQGLVVERRKFIALLGGAAAWPLAARAQQPAMPVVGFLNNGSAEAFALHMDAFKQGLNDAGYVDGKNVTIEYRWAEGDNSRLPALVADLVGRPAALIAATGGVASALAAKSGTTTTPVVFAMGADPVRFGLVASLNRPGGNITGVSYLANTILEKQIEMLHESVSRVTAMGFLVNPTNRMPSRT